MEPAASFGGVLSQRVALQCAIMCVSVAQETINLAYTRRDVDPNSVGPVAAWWYNVLFVYSAATVLVAAKLCTSLLSEISPDSISQSWNQAIELLRHYQDSSPVVEQLVAALHLLYNVLPEHYLQAKETCWLEGRSSHAFSANSRGSAPMVPPYTGAVQSRISDLDASQLGDEAGGMDLGAMVPDRGLAYSDFDFAFDSNDLSWLHTMPFEL